MDLEGGREPALSEGENLVAVVRRLTAEAAGRDDLVVPFRTGYLRLRAEESQRIVRAAQRRFRKHNAGRRWVEGEVWASMSQTWRTEPGAEPLGATAVKETIRSLPEVRQALERMWPSKAQASPS